MSYHVYSLCATSIAAANVISHLPELSKENWRVELRDEIAEIIERETHSKEVMEVLRSAIIALSIPEGYMVSDVQKQIRALIAKLEE